jgi:spore coat protein U-like protein
MLPLQNLLSSFLLLIQCSWALQYTFLEAGTWQNIKNWNLGTTPGSVDDGKFRNCMFSLGFRSHYVLRFAQEGTTAICSRCQLTVNESLVLPTGGYVNLPETMLTNEANSTVTFNWGSLLGATDARFMNYGKAVFTRNIKALGLEL